MSARLPDLDPDALRRRLQEASPVPLTEGVLDALAAHYRELARWSPRLSLVGPGTVDELFTRHYGESLAALPFLPPSPRRLLDVGSGAGFPGLVLAAARPDLEVTLVESRERKWAFLQAAVRRAGLSCRCLDARVQPGQPLPSPRPFDLLTLRAVKLTPGLLSALRPHLTADCRLLLWTGGGAPPPGTVRVAASHPLPGSRRRRLLVALLAGEEER